jgi:hypothetical protein
LDKSGMRLSTRRHAGQCANPDRDKGKSDVQAWSYILHFAT